MLHAFISKNARRILQPKGNEHSIDKAEDAATSMVFTPLAFMTSVEALACLCAVIGPPAYTAAAGRTPLSHQLDLWPQGLTAFSTSGEGQTRCEPDLVAAFAFDDGEELVFIGEMKWNWLMGAGDLEAELAREVAAVRRLKPGAEQVVFVVSQYAYRPMSMATVLTWRTFHARLRPLLEGDARRSSAIWADLVGQFLDRADQMGFTGIPVTQTDERWTDAPAFWRNA